MDDVDQWHQAISHHGGPDGRPGCHIADQVQSLREGNISDQDVLPRALRLQGLDQADEMLTCAVE